MTAQLDLDRKQLSGMSGAFLRVEFRSFIGPMPEQGADEPFMLECGIKNRYALADAVPKQVSSPGGGELLVIFSFLAVMAYYICVRF